MPSDEPTPFETLGGAEGVRALVDRFYDLMDELAEARTIRALHPPDLAESREKLYLFLSGWTGGPPLYLEKHGHPRLRARHLPFPIDTAARDAWILCMERALEEHPGLDGVFRQTLLGAFFQTADFMRNREDAE